MQDKISSEKIIIFLFISEYLYLVSKQDSTLPRIRDRLFFLLVKKQFDARSTKWCQSLSLLWAIQLALFLQFTASISRKSKRHCEGRHGPATTRANWERKPYRGLGPKLLRGMQSPNLAQLSEEATIVSVNVRSEETVVLAFLVNVKLDSNRYVNPFCKNALERSIIRARSCEKTIF